ncbi:HNH endonuclease [Methanobrevibacter filiformis]|uniref:HNH nuclease domain-containing protein n=1 Tax=Methanobrevibacter filiformis TaxID=55758 RepID=A0A162FDT4_9EURY|nr:HNH endonuclease [Methanobrevibacter filiformis]KZX11545.1 hypothetical protein MBFIL_14210 [Methanobrevibacter filiformis]
MINKRLKVKEKDIKILYGQAGNQCSMDGCNNELIISKDNSTGEKYQIGEMAHIYPNSNNFVRGNYELDEEDKVNEKNLILLCPKCHKLIDNDPEKYTAEKLLEMKEKHINKIKILKETALLDFTFDDFYIASKNIICDENIDNGNNILKIDSNPLEIDVKIRKNDLTQISRNLILQGNLKQHQIKEFIAVMSKEDDKFPYLLQNSFKKEFNKKKNDFIGDKLFLELYDFSRKNLSNSETAASLAILCYLFAICEIFEK